MSPTSQTPPTRSRGRVLWILGVYLLLSLSIVFTTRPQPDEAIYANPGYNLLYNGQMGTTIYELSGFMPASLAQRTYWQPPLYFVTTAAWYRIAGFGLIQVRLLSVLFGLLALYSWNSIARSLFPSPNVGLLVTGLVSVDYFFVLGASQGRMDVMCAALGIAAVAVYLRLRKKSFARAIFWSHMLATLSVVTHPAGLGYWLGLVFLILYFDRRLLSIKAVIIAALPCLIGGLAWGAYIAQDPDQFITQMHGILNSNLHSFEGGPWSDIPFLRNLQKEVFFRYVAPFGLAGAVGLAQRLKAFVLLAYVVGIGGTLLMSRRHPNMIVFPALTLIMILYIALASPSKYSYYLPHTTMFMAACFAVFVSHLDFADTTRKRLMAAAVLAIALIQMSGLAFRARQNSYGHSFLPAAAAIVQHSPPGSLVMASGELWFPLQPERRLLHDPVLGYRNGLKPAMFVMDPLYHMLHDQQRIATPQIYAHVQSYLEHSQLVYDDGYYQVYVPQAYVPQVTRSEVVSH